MYQAMSTVVGILHLKLVKRRQFVLFAPNCLFTSLEIVPSNKRRV